MITLEKDRKLKESMARQGVRESDLIEQFVCSSGPGGQNVNKVSSCVVLKHKPSGIVIKCQKERLQILNRYLARILLLKKIHEIAQSNSQKEKAAKEKKRRQNRRLSKTAKLIMLEKKSKRSNVKASRRKTHRIDD